MADYTTENLELIVRYDGSRTSFDSSAEKASYINAKISKVVFITGSTASNAIVSDKTQHIWVSNGTSHKYLDMTNIDDIKAGLTHIAGFAIDGEIKSGTGANGINFKGINGIGITLSDTGSTDTNGVPYWTIQVDGTGLIGLETDKPYDNTINGAKAYAATAVNGLKGTDKDDSSKFTIYGTRAYIEDKETSLIGNAETDDKDSPTIVGAKMYADEAVAKIVSDGNDAAADDTIKGAKLYTDAAKESLFGASNDGINDNTILGVKNYVTQLGPALDVSIVESDGTGAINKVYTFYQGEKTEGNKLGTINIPKELVVKSGQVVVNPSGQPAGTYIELTIQNQDTPLYINVADLVDAYTGVDTDTIDITISTDNKISASIKSDSIETSMLKNSAVTTDKINDGAVTTNKINDGAVSYDKLDQSVKTSLNKVDSAVTDVGVKIETGDDIYLYGYKTSSGPIRTINLDVKTETIGNATSDVTKKGLATAEDVAAYLAARLSVKVVS